MELKKREKGRELLLRRVFTPGDAVLIFVVLALGVTMLAHPWRGRNGVAAKKLVVEVNGREAMRFYLEGNDGEHSVEGFRGLSVFRVEEGEVWMVDSDCPDKLCVGMGRIREAGQAIVCLPNRVTLRLVGAEGIDAVQR